MKYYLCNVHIVRYVCCEVLLYAMSISLGISVVKYYCIIVRFVCSEVLLYVMSILLGMSVVKYYFMQCPYCCMSVVKNYCMQCPYH